MSEINFIEDHNIPTITHELHLFDMKGLKLPAIQDENDEHCEIYLEHIVDEIEHITKFGFIGNGENSKIILLLEMKPNNRSFEYTIEIPIGGIKHIVGLKSILILGKKGNIVAGFTVSDEQIKELYNFYTMKIVSDMIGDILK